MHSIVSLSGSQLHTASAAMRTYILSRVYAEDTIDEQPRENIESVQKTMRMYE